MKPCYSLGNMPKIKPYHVPGSSMTVPGLAPSLISMLEANSLGEPLPMVGKPLFDDSEDSGSARLSAGKVSLPDMMANREAFEVSAEKESSTTSTNAPDKASDASSSEE